MRRFLAWLTVILVLLVPLQVGAQGAKTTSYYWQPANLSLAYPATWDKPVTLDQGGATALQLAQVMATTPDTRPPGVPVITLLLNPDPNADPNAALAAAFQTQGLTPGASTPDSLMGFDAVKVTGFSEDKTLFGIGRAAKLPDSNTLIVLGRAAAAGQNAFSQVFEAVTSSMALGTSEQPAQPTYGILWYSVTTAGDGANAYTNVGPLALAPDGDLYAADPAVGVLQLDAKTGQVKATVANLDLSQPTGIAVGKDRTVYVGDAACQCVFVLGADGKWKNNLGNFGEQSPASIAMTADGTLYATNQTDTGVELLAFQNQKSSTIPFDEPVTAQPVLVIDRGGRLLALVNDGTVLALEDGRFATLATLNLNNMTVNAAADLDGGYLLATDGQGLVVISPQDDSVSTIGQVVPNAPGPGDFVNPRGIQVGTDGTLYISDSDGSFGAITAMSTSIEPGRIGGRTLVAEIPVRGVLNTTRISQDWTLNGLAGQEVTLSAVDASGSGALDLALHLIAPDGTEDAANDNQESGLLTAPTDAQIANYVLKASGAYTVRVSRVDGGGTYVLGVSLSQAVTLNPSGVTRVTGVLGGVLPTERWIFDGKAGQTFTLTLNALDGTLDPALTLLDASGKVIAQNDDAKDTALGPNAQLPQVKLPANGRYILEASRSNGEGHYELIIAAPGG
jgi:sugar lactone lactonase YvrE